MITGPLGFELLRLGQLLAFGDLLKLRVELRQLAGIQAQLGNAALVIDRHRGLVRDGALDVVDGNVIAKDRPRIRVRLLDGRAGELLLWIASFQRLPVLRVKVCADLVLYAS